MTAPIDTEIDPDRPDDAGGGESAHDGVSDDETADPGEAAQAEATDEAAPDAEATDQGEAETDDEASPDAETADPVESAEGEATDEAETDDGGAEAADDGSDADGGAPAELTDEAEVGGERADRGATTGTALVVARPTAAWSLGDLRVVAAPLLAVLIVAGGVGFSLGMARGPAYTARQEIVYTLDESIPDGFLREDRRLLTQLATLESEAVLGPVADRFDLDVEDLRAKLDVETIELSEVIRIDVTDDRRATATAINSAVVESYIRVVTAPVETDETTELTERRDALVDELADVDQALVDLDAWQVADAGLAARDERLTEQLVDRSDELSEVRTAIDEARVSAGGASTVLALNARLEELAEEVDTIEADLAAVRTERAALAQPSTTEPALTRERARLETELTTLDDELAQRRLGPLVSSPIRPLGPISLHERSAVRSGITGLAIGVLVGLPLAVAAAYRRRRRHLWLD